MSNLNLIEEFFQKTGYKFKNIDLLKEALTHPSLTVKCTTKRGCNYERLEFLGDAVLSMVISEYLIENYQDENEGSISSRHTALVCGKTLARIGKTMGIVPMIFMSKGEETGGGRENESNIENVVEALVGAIYLDGGLEPVKKLIDKFWSSLAKENLTPPKDPKTELQEWSQKYKNVLPVYELITQEGRAHSPTFTIKLSIDGVESVEAKGHSKKDAEKKAAISMLKKLKN